MFKIDRHHSSRPPLRPTITRAAGQTKRPTNRLTDQPAVTAGSHRPPTANYTTITVTDSVPPQPEPTTIVQSQPPPTPLPLYINTASTHHGNDYTDHTITVTRNHVCIMHLLGWVLLVLVKQTRPHPPRRRPSSTTSLPRLIIVIITTMGNLIIIIVNIIIIVIMITITTVIMITVIVVF